MVTRLSMGYEPKHVILVSYTRIHRETRYIRTKTRRHGNQGHTLTRYIGTDRDIIHKGLHRHDTHAHKWRHDKRAHTWVHDTHVHKQT